MTTTDAQMPEIEVQRIGYTKAEAAVRVGLSVDSISAAIANGDLAAKKYGSKPLISPRELARWFDALPDA